MCQFRGSVLFLAGATVLTGLSGCRAQEAPPELPPRAIQWQRISSAAAYQQFVIPGIVTAVTDTQLAFDVGGLVESVEVALGDDVEKDQVLARLDPEPFELAVRDAEAALDQAAGAARIGARRF